MKRLVLSVLGGVWLLAGAGAQANWSMNLHTDRASGIEIHLSSPIDTIPNCGYAPITILVRNHSNAAHSWNFRSVSRTYLLAAPASLSLDCSIDVASGASSTIRVLAPIYPTVPPTGPAPLALTITGYGVENGYNAYFPAAQGDTLPILVSETLDGELWAQLRTKVTKTPFTFPRTFHGRPAMASASSGPAGSLVDLKELGSDWRALLGFQSFWLTPADFAGLDPGTQTAIRDWVAQGGQLYFCADGPEPAVRAAFGFPDDTADQVARGCGFAHWGQTRVGFGPRSICH